MSTFSSMLPSEAMLGVPFPTFEGGFTPWEYQQLLSVTQPTSNSGSDSTSQNNHTLVDNSNSNSNSNSNVIVDDERKKRRMISNRESARRSRMRKQKHLENLRSQLNRLRIQNRDLTNRLRFALYQCHLVQNENDQLRSENIMLRQKLSGISQILVFQQLQQFSSAASASAWPPCNSTSAVTSVNEQQQIPSLIT